MPTYDYECNSCGAYTEHIVSYENHDDFQDCASCGLKGVAGYVISMPNVEFFTPYHDESLNCDINGRRHRQQVMAAQGVQEAGDRVGGARNFEKSANNGGILPVNGQTHDDTRRTEDKRRQQGEDMVVGIDTSNSYGETKTAFYRAKDLECKSETTSKSIGQIIREG
tara:strand:- start:1367 stop:1867 length:501 start_codon:yes stop_codon:yes gene_type:complete